METIETIEKNLEGVFAHLSDVALFNQEKVLKAFQKNRVSANSFFGTTGYGYDDVGRQTL